MRTLHLIPATFITGAMLLFAQAPAFGAQTGAQTGAPNGAQTGAQAAPQQAPAAPPQPNQATPPAASAEDKVPRAKSQEELEAYQKFMREQNPDEQIHQIEDFLLQYPNTELKEYAYQAATQAYQAKNDFAKVMTYGELTLGENGNNMVALLILASAIPERTAKTDLDREAKLTQAEQYAKHGLDILERLPMPPNLTEEQWTQIKKDAEATPHAALGMIALIREDFAKSEAELKMANDMAAKPDPILLYRLGLCYSFEKKYDPAVEVLDRAAASGGVKIIGANGETRDLVAEAKDFALKAKAASETPVSGAETAAPAAEPPASESAHP